MRTSWEDFYLQSGDFLQDMWHYLTKERCCYCGQHYPSVVGAHRCLETLNPELLEVGQKQRPLFKDRNLIFPAAWADLNTNLWFLFGNVSPHNTSRPLCCNPTPSQQRCFECLEMPPPTKINMYCFSIYHGQLREPLCVCGSFMNSISLSVTLPLV